MTQRKTENQLSLATQLNKQPHSKKCAKFDCDDCPAHVPTHFVPSDTYNENPQIDIHYGCLRTYLKKFISNLKD